MNSCCKLNRYFLNTFKCIHIMKYTREENTFSLKPKTVSKKNYSIAGLLLVILGESISIIALFW